MFGDQLMGHTAGLTRPMGPLNRMEQLKFPVARLSVDLVQ